MTTINTLVLTLVTHATAAYGASNMLGYGTVVQVRAGRKAAVICVHLTNGRMAECLLYF